MHAVLLVLGALALVEGAIIWYVVQRYRLQQAEARGAGLGAAHAETAEARRVLAEQNRLEGTADAVTVETAPGLDDAIARVNGLH